MNNLLLRWLVFSLTCALSVNSNDNQRKIESNEFDINSATFLQFCRWLAEAIAIIDLAAFQITFCNPAFRDLFSEQLEHLVLPIDLKDFFGDQTDYVVEWIEGGVPERFYFHFETSQQSSLLLDVAVFPSFTGECVTGAILVFLPASLEQPTEPIEREDLDFAQLSEFFISDVPSIGLEISKPSLEILQQIGIRFIFGVDKLKSFDEFFQSIHPEDRKAFSVWLDELLERDIAVSSYQVRVQSLTEDRIKWVHIHTVMDTLSCSFVLFEMPLTGIRSNSMQAQTTNPVAPTHYPFNSRWTPNGVLKEVSDELCDNLKVPREQMLGNCFFPFLHPDDQAKMHLLLQSITPQKPATAPYINRIVQGDQVLYHEWIDVGIFGPDGSLIELYSMGRPLEPALALV